MTCLLTCLLIWQTLTAAEPHTVLAPVLFSGHKQLSAGLGGRAQKVKHEDGDDVEDKAERAKREAKEKAGQARGWFGRKKEETKDATSDAGHSAHHGLHKAAVRRPRLPPPRRASRRPGMRKLCVSCVRVCCALAGCPACRNKRAFCLDGCPGLQVRQVVTGAG